METSAEMNQREKVMKYVKQYVLITLSISIMSVGVYFFKFPNNFVFGGVTGTAALVAKLTPMSASAFSSAANLVLLVVGLIFLGKEFAMTTGYATFVMSVPPDDAPTLNSSAEAMAGSAMAKSRSSMGWLEREPCMGKNFSRNISSADMTTEA